jgi:hypothetical protein
VQRERNGWLKSINVRQLSCQGGTNRRIVSAVRCFAKSAITVGPDAPNATLDEGFFRRLKAKS